MIITGGYKYKGRKIIAPDESIARPTLSKVRMGVFNILYSILGDFENKSFLDLFGGSGIMGLEALSRGFEKVTVFEKKLKAAQVIRRNYELLGLKPDLKVGDSLKLLKHLNDFYDVIYIDPPYKSGIYEEIFSSINTNSIVIAEHSEKINPSDFTLLKQKNYGGKLISIYSPLTHGS